MLAFSKSLCFTKEKGQNTDKKGEVMSKTKTCSNRVFVAFCALLASVLFASILGSDSFAAGSGIITDANDTRWEYSVEDATADRPQRLTIRFYDKTPSATTVTVPSLDWLKSNVPGASADLDTYFLKDAFPDLQDEDYPTETRRAATAETTKLDMSNTSKIQIIGVKPIINPEVETELVFGENMVIGEKITKTARIGYCKSRSLNASNQYYCRYAGYSYEINRGIGYTIEEFEDFIPNWDRMTDEEQEAYMPSYNDVLAASGCVVAPFYLPAADYDPNVTCYVPSGSSYQNYYIENKRVSYAFAGYKLKLTNFDDSKFNYVGWKAFSGSTFNEANTTMTISGSSFAGSDIFEKTNVKNITINTDTIGSGLFRGCQHIESITFGEGIDNIVEDTFAGTNLTSFDFTNSGIKRVKARAFEGANLTSVNFTGLERIDWQAFKDNDIKEISLPKSLLRIEGEVFRGNDNLKKVTIAYDTLSSGMILPFWVVLSNQGSIQSVEEVNVIAPYAADEPVGATHVSYDDYRWHFDIMFNYTEQETDRFNNKTGLITESSWNAGWPESTGARIGKEYQFEDLYANVDSYKNVLAPHYFANFNNLKKITIGEGYEYIGTSAFWYTSNGINGWATSYNQHIDGTCDWYVYRQGWVYNQRCGEGSGRYLEKIQLPETLKGVGNLAFEGSWATQVDVNLPRSLEFIGLAAFRALFHMTGDFDLPNIKYIGDHAFRGTALRNITIHDSIYYWGIKAFSDIPTIQDITIDCDLYDPDRQIIWTYINELNYDSNDAKLQVFKMQFGHYNGYGSPPATDEEKEYWGIRTIYNQMNSTEMPKFGKITFTEKVIHEIPMLSHYTTPGADWMDSINGIDGNSSYGNWFGETAADEIDLSATAWKIVPRNFMKNVIVDKLTLPHNLETISHHAFVSLMTKEELVIPDSVKIIGAYAFESFYTSYRYYDGILGERDGLETPIITKLPSSLEYIGYHAFWGDKNLTADLNAPNLQYIGPEAFMDTGIRDVLIPSGVKWLGEGTFWSPNLRDITIDADFGAITSVNHIDDYVYPEYLADWAGNAIEASYEIATMYFKKICLTSPNYCPGGWEETFKQGKHLRSLSSIFVKNYGLEGSALIAADQRESGDSYGSIVFTDKNVTDLKGDPGIFSGLTIGTVDMGAANWTKITEQPYAFANAHIGTLILPGGVKTITEGAFHDAVIDNEFSIPATTKTIGRAAFQNATASIMNVLPEGVKNIGGAAFYEADVTDNLVIPSTVEYVGFSAFNAGSKDVHYDTVTIKPSLTFAETDNQLVHQFMWNSSIDKLIIDSENLPALDYGAQVTGVQEFWNMDMTSVEINNLPGISYGAFDSCADLKTVDMSNNSVIRNIGEEAFIRAGKLDMIKFSPAVKNETISVGPNAFAGTGFTELGDSSTGFDLTAAKFDASVGHSFASMPKLKKVTVPRNFSGATIPEYTFYNNVLLEEAQIDYKITDIKNAAFALDNNLKRIFIWGDTIVQDDSLDGYAQPTRGRTRAVVGPTIPEATDIYAYSTSKTEAYAASPERSDFNGTFYPLDEVLYLTSNHPTVLLNEDDTDFDKSNLIVYAMRRDGIILESDSWQEFDGNAYSRAGKGLNFEHMAETIAENEAFGTVWDTPVPVSELDLSNQNFANLAYLIRPADDDPAVLTVDLKHTDAYTAYLANTNVDPRDYVPEPIPDEPDEPTPDEPIPAPTPDTPKTGDEIVKFVTVLSGAVAAAGTLFFIVKRRR